MCSPPTIFQPQHPISPPQRSHGSWTPRDPGTPASPVGGKQPAGSEHANWFQCLTHVPGYRCQGGDASTLQTRTAVGLPCCGPSIREPHPFVTRGIVVLSFCEPLTSVNAMAATAACRSASTATMVLCAPALEMLNSHGAAAKNMRSWSRGPNLHKEAGDLLSGLVWLRRMFKAAWALAYVGCRGEGGWKSDTIQLQFNCMQYLGHMACWPSTWRKNRSEPDLHARGAAQIPTSPPPRVALQADEGLRQPSAYRVLWTWSASLQLPQLVPNLGGVPASANLVSSSCYYRTVIL